MAKRFTDTEKWKDEWWGPLSNDYRMIWLYLVDSCSIAGLWKKDFRSLNFNCNTKITEAEFLEVFGSRIIDKGNFFFIPKFLRFQCPKGLNSNKPAIVSIVNELQLNNLIPIVHKQFGNDYLIIKDKGKGKDKGEGKTKENKTADPDKFTDEWFSEIFDSLTVESYRTTFREHDLENEFKIFRLKVRGSPNKYAHRDTEGIRQAFIYQLSNSNGHSKRDKKSPRRADAIIEPPAGDYGKF